MYVLTPPSMRLMWIVGVLLASSSVRAEDTQYTLTKYPIVLVPGALGFNAALGMYHYWFGITQELQAGGAKVYLAQISPLNSSEERGEQLVLQIQRIIAVTGASKVNLLGHSHGGPTARYAAAVVPELVASVTTIGSPHAGSALADMLAVYPGEGTVWRKLMVGFCNTLANFLSATGGGAASNDGLAALGSMTTVGAAVFNGKYPAGMPAAPCSAGDAQVNGQRYYSWGGVGTHTNIFDPSDFFLALMSRLFVRANDGMVDQCSSHFGQVIRDDYLQNHLDGVNQAIGLVSPRGPNSASIFRAHANRLKNAGL